MPAFLLISEGIKICDAEALIELTNAMAGRFSSAFRAEYSERRGKKAFVMFFWDRYTMDENGFHIGYESWEVYVPLVDAKMLGWNNTPRCCWGDKVALLTSDNIRVHLASHPKQNDAYSKPDDDFGWQEFEHQLNGVLQEMQKAERVYEKEHDEWFLVSPNHRISFGSISEKIGVVKTQDKEQSQ